MTRQELTQLGEALDRSGLATHEFDLRRLARDARDVGVTGAALDVLADTAAPDVARLRAFAAVSAAVLRTPLASGGSIVRPVA